MRLSLLSAIGSCGELGDSRHGGHFHFTERRRRQRCARILLPWGLLSISLPWRILPASRLLSRPLALLLRAPNANRLSPAVGGGGLSWRRHSSLRYSMTPESAATLL